jgi:hypothetical protein
LDIPSLELEPSLPDLDVPFYPQSFDLLELDVSFLELEPSLPVLELSSLDFNFPLPVLQDLTHVEHKYICKICSKEIPVENSLDPLQQVYDSIRKIIDAGKYPIVSEILDLYNKHLSGKKYESHKRYFRRIRWHHKLEDKSKATIKFLSDLSSYLHKKICELK